MKIVLTNDDGIEAEGLHALIEALKDEHDLIVVAPDKQNSGSGHGVTFFHTEHDIERVEIEGVKEAWKVISGTPADCCAYAIYAICKEKPDVIISGVNHGSNISTDCLYSGTLGAAQEATMASIPGIAVSLCDFFSKDFEASVKILRKLLPIYMSDPNNTEYTLNINIPPIPYEEIKGIRVANFEGRRIFGRGIKVEEVDENKKHVSFDVTTKILVENQHEQGDGTLIKNGYATVTPIETDMVAHHHLEAMKKFEEIK